MTKGLTYHLRQAWKRPGREMLKERMIEWRASDAAVKLERPTRLDRARALGYKAKRGFIILRIRVNRGGRKRPRAGVKGRKTKNMTNRKTLKMNYKWVAEIRAARKYPSLEVLNSYNLGKDGKHYFYEIIMVDPSKPEIKKDRTTKWIVNDRKRAERGRTSAARKSRGLRGKSPKKKVRPSLRARNRQGK
jgi:large subunit ribosomal protein L15e